MKTPQRTITALEFGRVLKEAARYTRSATGSEATLAIRPLSEAAHIEQRFAIIAELRRMSDDSAPLRLGHFEDIRPALDVARPAGYMLDAKDLLIFIPVLSNIESVLVAIDERDENTVSSISEMLKEMAGFPGLLSDLERSINSDGEILDTASKELKRLRQGVRALDQKISRRLGEITRQSDTEPFLQDSFVTKRSGRWVLPVRMDSKGMVNGVVHDVSRSGETAFMEPLEIIGLSNELENLSAEAKAEEIRILKKLSSTVRESADMLEMEFGLLVNLDMLIALAQFADKLNAEQPTAATESGELKLHGARHPLLMMLGGGSDSVVPLDIVLDGVDSLVMVITGPNAGGKTIAIKTVGLLTLMAASGMPIPARSESRLPLTGSLLVDIGDEQSIEESLSTFTAHAKSIGDIVRNAGPGSLVLLDELGTGTDPLQGAAISCGVLSELRRKGALVIATTHLTDIVAYVHNTDAMLNASMEIDLTTMSPLYRLIAGEPGQSHAIEAAERSGMPEEVISFAREMAGHERLELESMLHELKSARAAYEKQLEDTRQERAEIENNKRLIKQELDNIKRARDKELAMALKDAKDEAARIKRELHAMLEEAKASKKPRAVIKAVDKAASEIAGRIDELSDKKKFIPLPIEEIAAGTRVFVSSLSKDVEVAHVDRERQRVRIRVGQKELDLPVSQVGKPLQAKADPTVRGGTVTSPASTISDVNVSTEIKLIGLRVEEALDRLEPFINHASLAGMRTLRVIHGLGTGALRRGVREFLQTHPLIESYNEAAPEEGAGGVTIAHLK